MANFFERLRSEIAEILERRKFGLDRQGVHRDPEGYRTVLVNPILSAGKSPEKSIEENLLYIGNNTGNLLFVEGMKEQISYDKEMWYRGETVEDVRKPAAIIPSANFIIHGGDGPVQDIMGFLEANDCPVTMAGLGAQSTDELNTPEKLVEVLTPLKRECFRIMSERAVTLGVRGQFTADCLELMGIHNYRIIGCPSFYKHLGGVYPPLAAPSLDRTQMTVTPKDANETRILEMGMRLNSVWMMQMMTEMPRCAFENQTISPVWVDRRFPELRVSLEEYSGYLKNNAKMFFRLDEWNRYYAEEGITFSYGSRFHGNMASIRNGIPALWIVHDSRTTELAETLHVPHITIEQFAGLREPEELLEYCVYDDMYAHYESLCQNYVRFLEENHISHRFRVRPETEKQEHS